MRSRSRLPSSRPLILLIVFGIIEFTLLLKDDVAVSSAVRAGARTASAEPRNAAFLDDTASQMDRAVATLTRTASARPWAASSGSTRPTPRVSRAAPPRSTPGGCGTQCVRYTWDAGDGKFVTTTAQKNKWVASSINACPKDPAKNPSGPDSVGVYLSYRHAFLTGVFGGGLTALRPLGAQLRAGCRDLQVTPLRARLALVVAERESGYVAVFVALCLPLLVGMCALAVDVATWQVEGTKAQKAADAAALAGTIYLPTSQAPRSRPPPTWRGSTATRRRTATSSPWSRTVKPTQLRVTITTTVNNTFGVDLRPARPRRSRVRRWPTTPVPSRWAARATSSATRRWSRWATRSARAECDEQARRLLDEHRRHEHEQGPW